MLFQVYNERKFDSREFIVHLILIATLKAKEVLKIVFL